MIDFTLELIIDDLNCFDLIVKLIV